MAGDPLNHAALLTPEQIDDFRARVGLTIETEWDRFDPESAAGMICDAVGGSINNPAPVPRPALPVPSSAVEPSGSGRVSVMVSFAALWCLLVVAGSR